MKGIKKYFGVFIFLFCVIMTACSSDSNGNGDKTSNSLTLYCISNDAKVDQYIAEFKSSYKDVEITKRAFDDAAQMDELVKSELNAGKGPDIIIFSDDSYLDVMRLAGSGTFKALDDEIINDEGLSQDNYLPGTFTAGKVDDKLYVLPLTFTIPTVTYDSKAELGFIPEPAITYGEFLDSLETSIMNLEDEQDYGAITFTSPMRQLLPSANAIDISFDKQSVEFDDAALKEVVQISYLMNSQGDKASNITTKYGYSYLVSAEHFTFIYDSVPDLTHFTWICDSLYRENDVEMGVSAFHQLNSKQVVANIDSYGVVTKNSNPYAYDFLRIAMDCNPTTNSVSTYGMSLNKLNIEDQIKAHQSLRSTTKIDGKSVVLSTLSDKKAELLRQIYDSITDVQINNRTITGMFIDSFSPYLDELNSYEECEKDFKQKMNLYMAE